MAPTLHALLVGIDDYPAPLNPLQGCVNDINAVHEVLTQGLPADHPLDIRKLTNEEAKVEAVTAALTQLANDVDKEDVALVYYTGHGSQAMAAADEPGEPEHLIETIVLWDSRQGNNRDLTDRQLGQLLDRVAARCNHLLVVLDCCHSGGGTRGLADAPQARMAPADIRPYPTQGAEMPRGHILWAACRSDELANETTDDGRQRGVFSVGIERGWRTLGLGAAYPDVFSAAAAAVIARRTDQHPVQDAVDNAEQGRSLLGPASVGPDLRTASAIGGDWWLDAGTLHGVASGAKVELRDLITGDVMGTATVGDAQAVRARLVNTPAVGLDQDGTYRAVVTSVPEQPLTVALRGTDADTLAVVGAALQNAPKLRVGDDGSVAVEAVGGRLRIVDATIGRPLAADVPNADPTLATLWLNQIAGWRSLLARRNPATQLPADTIGIELLDSATGVPIPGRDGASYLTIGSQQATARARLRVTNRSSQRLYFAAYDLDPQFGVSKLSSLIGYLSPGGQVVGNFQFVPPAGRTSATDVIKVFASTEQFPEDALKQDPLPSAPEEAEAAKNVIPDDGPASDWTAAELVVETSRDLPSFRLGPDIDLGSGVRILGHPELGGSARLRSSGGSARDAGVPLLPAVLLEADSAYAVSFGAERGVDGAPDLIDLTVENPEVVTREQPLQIALDQPVADNERLVAIAFDGRFYLPVGVSTGPEANVVAIQALPPATATAAEVARSLGGSLKLMFRRVVYKVTGHDDSDLYKLQQVTLNAAGEVEYLPVGKHDLENVQAVLLVVHGIIGDTYGMAEWALRNHAAPHGPYDVVLAFDYENLNTTLEKIAEQLRARLADLDAVVPKFVIVAHSMGGLVSRQMLETTGAAPVTALVTAGTPHLGSPLSAAEDVVLKLLATGLNFAAKLHWPGAVVAKLLSYLPKAVEFADVTLDEMAEDGPFIKQLGLHAAPGIPYFGVAGSTDLLDPDNPEGATFGALLEKLEKLHIPVELLYHDQPNDIAVLVTSAQGVPWELAAEKTVACDHVTYFVNPEGIAGLATVLGSA